MKLETILDAMVRANIDVRYYRGFLGENTKRVRQYHAFRARILRMDAEKDLEIELLKTEKLQMGKKLGRIGIDLHHKDRELAAKDARIAELKGYIVKHNERILK